MSDVASNVHEPDGPRKPLGLDRLTDADYRLMVDAVSDYAIFFLDCSGVILSWNAGAQKMKGYEPQEVIGHHISMFYPPELLERRWPDHELSLAREVGRFEDEGWRIRKDGTRFWAHVIFTKLVNSQGEFLGFSKITKDLSERRRQEELLRLSEERFRLLVEGVQDYAIFMLDPGGHVMSWNAGAQKNKGYTEAEILGKHFSIFYPQDVAASGWPAHELVSARRDGRFEDEGWRLRKDGTRFWASIVITSLQDATGRHRGFAKVTRDLTEKRRVHALEDEGRRITTFLAMLGHELRNPLAPIANALAIMQLEKVESRTTRMTREIIDRQLKQLTRLVEDLLDVGRITSGKIHLENKPVNIGEAALQAVESAQPLMQGKSHQLDVDMQDPDLWLAGDRARIVQVISNLLNNAAKFTPSGGRIRLSLVRRNTAAELSVSDNGPGIPPQDLQSIFNLFTQGEQDLARSMGGLGLGLSLVQQLVALHGGQISAFSKGVAGEGSEFVMLLPTIAAPQDLAETPETASTRKRRVLVVDDNHDAAETMAMLLDALGYSTAVVYDGPAAIDFIKTAPPAAVLLDIGLPGMTGIEVAKRVGAEFTNPPALIAVTGYGQERDREASSDAGFYAHLVKPVDIDQLTNLLERLLGKG